MLKIKFGSINSDFNFNCRFETLVINNKARAINLNKVLQNDHNSRKVSTNWKHNF